MDRHARTEWIHKYGVDPYLPGNSTMTDVDGVRVIGGKLEQGRLKDGALSEVADWKGKSHEETNKYTDAETRLPVKVLR